MAGGGPDPGGTWTPRIAPNERFRPRSAPDRVGPLSLLAFLGTPGTAVAPLRALVEAGHEVVLVVSRPDRRRHRGQPAEPSPVKAEALALGLRVEARVDQVVGSGAELGVVVAYGAMVPARVLARVPMVNLHFSLLPRWRGAAPVERAILAGDRVTGVCLMALEEGLDTGGIYDRREVIIGAEESAAELRHRLVDLGTQMLVERLAGGVRGLGEPQPQEGEPTYASKLGPEDFRLEWSRSATELARVVRAGRAWTTVRGRRLLVTRALPELSAAGGKVRADDRPGTLRGTMVSTGSGRLELVTVRPEGRSEMAAREWMRGARLAEPVVLGT